MFEKCRILQCSPIVFLAGERYFLAVLVYVLFTLRTPRVKPSYVTTRSFTNYDAEQFCKDLALVPFHVMSVFDDFDDQMDTFNILFADNTKSLCLS